MNVSPLEEYGLRCAVQLAALPEGQALSAPEIAEREGLSVEYVSKFMLLLKRGGLVKTIRGIKGGFLLTRAPSKVSVKEVFRALRQQPAEKADFCQSYSGKSDACVRSKACAIRPFWKMLSRHIEEFTERTTLQDFLETEEQTLRKVEGIVRAKFEEQQQSKEVQS
ncbi:Rrf2 family transcriptional regulator [bacterium]|jgi:Rrf2 family protein|nr:Rrf2 family transcriptional regulator [bacterium]